MDDRTTIKSARGTSRGGGPRNGLGVVVAWYGDDPGRVGEIGFVAPNQTVALGRNRPRPDDAEGWLELVRQRPGLRSATPPLESRALSRRQLELTTDGTGVLHVENVGQGAFRLNGGDLRRCEAREGDVIEVADELVLLVVRRALHLPPLQTYPASRAGAFGAPDRDGMVGESPAAWALRDRVAFLAGAAGHVFVTGESGVGKELVARALHALSSRAGHELIARSAASFPETLIDAELFGNLADYPNPGMPARPGLVGEAHGSTLFLDEIGELSEAMQARLLRLLDAGGEYTRLGEARSRRADLRLVAATNRPVERIKHDVLARLEHRIVVPPLAERREDIPLLARQMIARAASRDRAIASRFVDQHTGPRLAPDLIRALLLHRYTHHLREIARLLSLSMSSSEDDTLELTPEVRAEIAPVREPTAEGPTREDLVACLARHGGKRMAVVRELGLKDRFVLYRLLKRHGLDGEGTED